MSFSLFLHTKLFLKCDLNLLVDTHARVAEGPDVVKAQDRKVVLRGRSQQGPQGWMMSALADTPLQHCMKDGGGGGPIVRGHSVPLQAVSFIKCQAG